MAFRAFFFRGGFGGIRLQFRYRSIPQVVRRLVASSQPRRDLRIVQPVDVREWHTRAICRRRQIGHR